MNVSIDEKVEIALDIKKNHLTDTQILYKYGVKAETGRKWLKTYEEFGRDGFISQAATAQLCWDCAHAIPNPEKGHGCPWSTKFQPVPGWEATKSVKIKNGFSITHCPMFVGDEEE